MRPFGRLGDTVRFRYTDSYKFASYEEIMKPYAFDPERTNETGCCTAHDNPATHKWTEFQTNSHHKQKTERKFCKASNRSRRRRDKQRLHDMEG